MKYALEELNKVVEAPEQGLREWTAKIDAWKKADPIAYHKEASFDGILAQEAIQELWKLDQGPRHDHRHGCGPAPDVGGAVLQVPPRRARGFPVRGLGTMGFGLPAAMGAKIAHPDKLVVDIDGDGSLLMNIQEMATCYCEKIPVKVLLLNNQHLGMVVQWEDRFHASNRAHTYLGPIDHPEAIGLGNGIGPETRYPDFVTVAEGFGWKARSIHRKEDLIPALVEMIESSEPYLLDVAVPYQEHVLPMIPSGMTVKELIRE